MNVCLLAFQLIRITFENQDSEELARSAKGDSQHGLEFKGLDKTGRKASTNDFLRRSSLSTQDIVETGNEPCLAMTLANWSSREALTTT